MNFLTHRSYLLQYTRRSVLQILQAPATLNACTFLCANLARGLFMMASVEARNLYTHDSRPLLQQVPRF